MAVLHIHGLYNSLAKLSIQKVHYYLGYIVGFIVETTISILFTGGALTIDKILLKTFKEPVDLLLKGYKGAVNAAKSLLSKLMVAFKKILKALSNPKQLINDFLKFLDELFGIGKKEFSGDSIKRIGKEVGYMEEKY